MLSSRHFLVAEIAKVCLFCLFNIIAARKLSKQKNKKVLIDV